MSPNPFTGVARRVHDIASREAERASPPPRRFRCGHASPVRLDALSGNAVTLTEGDPDLSLPKGFAPEVGDEVLVSRDRFGNYNVVGVVGAHGDPAPAG